VRAAGDRRDGERERPDECERPRSSDSRRHAIRIPGERYLPFPNDRESGEMRATASREI